MVAWNSILLWMKSMMPNSPVWLKCPLLLDVPHFIYTFTICTVVVFQVACVMQASFIDPDREIMLLSGIDSAYTKQQLRNSFLMGSSFVDLLFNFASQFSSFRLTDVETALFCALMLIRPGKWSWFIHLTSHCTGSSWPAAVLKLSLHEHKFL